MLTDAVAHHAPSSKLGICNMCSVAAARYTCPACEQKSCSVTCINKHKEISDCSGVRDKTAMVMKSDMTNLTLLSDYRFLEAIDHRLDDGLRALTKQRIAERLPSHLARLLTESRKRKINLKIMPQHFARHQENTTRFVFAENKIKWHVKWVFHQANISFTDTSLDEDVPLVDLLRKYLEPNLSLGSSISPEEEETLAYYRSASYRRVSVLLKMEKCLYDPEFRDSNWECRPMRRGRHTRGFRARRGSRRGWSRPVNNEEMEDGQNCNDPMFHQMILSKSLRLNLQGKKVVEHPILYVVLSDHLDTYIDISSTDISEFHDISAIGSVAGVMATVPQKKDSWWIPEIGPQVTKKPDGLSFFDTFSENDSDSDDT